MSRKWERMVSKNTKAVNKQRIKQGKDTVYYSAKESKDKGERFVGRSIFLPILLVAIAAFFAFVGGLAGRDTLYWVTIGCYVLLALFFYLRRPFLNIGAKTLSSRRFTGDRTFDADDVKQITTSPGFIVIEWKGRRSSWVFSRFVNRFNTSEIEPSIKKFAQNNSIPLIERAK